MTPIDDVTEELLSRGLDADLERAEVRALYRAAADDPAVAAAMGRMAALEDALLWADAPVRAAAPRRAVAPATAGRPRDRVRHRLRDWLRAPRGLAVQPLSFAVGATAALLIGLAMPPVLEPEVVADRRFELHDLGLTDARTNLDWTYQFILRPGQTTRLSLDLGDTLPVRVRIEAPRPTAVTLVHRAPGWRRGSTRDVTVRGILYATLANPRPGDALEVANRGSAPVVVYAYTNGYGGSRVDPGGQAL